MNRRLVYFGLAFLLSGLVVRGAAASTLERDSIARFHVTSVVSGDVIHLHIRGLPFYSASTGCSNLKVETQVPSAVRELIRYSVSKSDDTVTYRGRSYAGQMLLLQQLGKADGALEAEQTNVLESRQL